MVYEIIPDSEHLYDFKCIIATIVALIELCFMKGPVWHPEPCLTEKNCPK